MKRFIFLIPWLLAAFTASAQISTLPSSMGTFTVFKESSVPVRIVMPAGYVIDSPVVELWNNNVKLSDSTQVTVSGDTIKFTLTKQQIAPLNRNPYFFVKLGGTYALGAVLNPTIGVGLPTGQSKSISLPSIGTVRVNLLGDSVAAVNAAAAAEEARDQAVQAKNDVIVSILGKANYKEVNTVSDLAFPLPIGIIIVKEDTTVGTTQVQLYYNDGTAATVNDLWILPMVKRSTVIK